MNPNCSIIITSIAKDNNQVLQTFAQECKKHNANFIVIGDKPSPIDFKINGCDFYGLEAQKKLDFEFAQLVPERHYSRKNIGYLIAIQKGTELIVETDDVPDLRVIHLILVCLRRVQMMIQYVGQAR